MSAFEDDFGPRKKTPGAMNKYTPPGTTVAGLIVSDPEVRVVRDYATGEPRLFSDGNPMKQWVFRVQTELRDPSIPGDDGVRAIYVKGHNKKRLRECADLMALPEDQRVIRRGGWLSDTYVREDGDAKIHDYRYRPPAVGDDDRQPVGAVAGGRIREDHQAALRGVGDRAVARAADVRQSDEPPF